MSIPTYDQFIEPILRYLAARPEGAPAKVAHDAAAEALGITEEERQQLIPSGQPVYKNRAGWAHDRLKRAGLSSSPQRGIWMLTEAGKKFVVQHPAPLSNSELQGLAIGFTGQNAEHSTDLAPGPSGISLEGAVSKASPDERLTGALTEIRDAVTVEILEALSGVSPTFFETIVLDLLHRMGYGASRDDLQRVGGTGDGGIDGIISLDKLGLEKVYVQAKRWQQSVGRPDIQAFYGALAGQRASKGVFITTSSYTTQAHEFARTVEKFVLIDGQKLAALMIQYEVGVSSRAIRIPKLDSDYFDEETI